jgi:hypothetical protein
MPVRRGFYEADKIGVNVESFIVINLGNIRVGKERYKWVLSQA